MFEKIKQKATETKNWLVEHKTDVAYFAGSIVGSLVTAAVYSHDNKKRTEENLKRYPHEANVLSMRKHADYMDGLYGTGETTLGELSDKLISNGGVADSKVIGALVYTKK